MQKIYILGSVIAVAVVGAALFMFAAGFQDSATKIGVVDLGKVVEMSDMTKQLQSDLQGMVRARNDLLVFLDTNKVASQEQTLKLKELWLKTTTTAAEKTELDAVKAAVLKSYQKYLELQQKPSPTTDETTLLNEFGARVRANALTVQRLDGEFAQEMQDKRRELLQKVVDKARLSVQEVAKAGAYSAVFDIQVAPYGANDLTEATMKAMNAKKNP
ncbi:MAG: OmpH family outer membrane protein [Fimbriimonadaceae bacterium]